MCRLSESDSRGFRKCRKNVNNRRLGRKNMSNQGSSQLNACKTELKNIIVGLEDIENHVRANYKNIGNIQS